MCGGHLISKVDEDHADGQSHSHLRTAEWGLGPPWSSDVKTGKWLITTRSEIIPNKAAHRSRRRAAAAWFRPTATSSGS